MLCPDPFRVPPEHGSEAQKKLHLCVALIPTAPSFLASSVVLDEQTFGRLDVGLQPDECFNPYHFYFYPNGSP